MFVGQHRLEAFLDPPPTCPEHGRQAGVQGGHDPAVAPAIACLGDIGFEQNPRLENLRCRAPALVDQGFKRLTLFRTQPNHVFLDRDLWHDSIPDDVMMTLPESHRLLSESTT